MARQLLAEKLAAWKALLPPGCTLGPPLRYGENPHQDAAFFYAPNIDGIYGGELLQDGGKKEVSYNNVPDGARAMQAAYVHGTGVISPVAAIVKHNSVCGLASGPDLLHAYESANACDPTSAFGGIVGVNGTINAALAAAMIAENRYLEVVVGRDFEPDAIAIFSKKKSMRIIKVPELIWGPQIRTVPGGFLIQDPDMGEPDGAPEWITVTKRQPDGHQMDLLRFAWKVLPFVMSNSIAICKAYQVWTGGGQPNRKESATIAVKNAGVNADNAVAASDAFFPFPDAMQVLANAGVKAIAHTGGSIRDQEVIDAADALGIVLVKTGIRHFAHG